MSLAEIKLLLSVHFGEDVVLGEETGGLQPALLIEPAQIANVCFFLRDHPLTYFDFLSCLTGVHHEKENRFEVIYHLASIPYQTQLTLKINTEKPVNESVLPSFPTLYHVYRTADWHEREAYDLIGINFEGHPDLRRILLPDDWEGFPLRKDYKSAEYYKGIKID